jgi:hypothetical protein
MDLAMSPRARLLSIVLLAASIGSIAPAALYAGGEEAKRAETAAWIHNLDLPAYEAQKVVYHVDFAGGFFNRRYKHLLQVAKNHADAVGPGLLDLRIVMQGDGADLLAFARGDAAAGAAIDALKARGVRFLICRNTLVQRGIDPDRDLYGVARQDVLRAAVGEIAALEAQGFRYMKPGG